MDTKKIIIDSSVWIAYFNEDDSQHKKAEEVLNKQTKQLIVPEYILLEVVSVLRQKKKEVSIADFISIALKNDVFLPTGDLVIRVANHYSDEIYKKLSFVDVALAVLSKKYDIITFDKELQKVINK